MARGTPRLGIAVMILDLGWLLVARSIGVALRGTGWRDRA